MKSFRRLTVWTSGLILGWMALATTAGYAAEGAARRLLFYHRSAGFQHSVVEVHDGKPCFAEVELQKLCDENHWELTSTKDGSVFTPANLATYDAYLFYTTEDLTNPESTDGSPPMSAEGKQAFMDAVAGGKGFVGFHCASDTFHSPGNRQHSQPVEERDPYIRMLGGEFLTHGSQQPTTMTVKDVKFPGAASLGEKFRKEEEWYALKNFADDLHVLLVNETEGMHDPMYQRPPYPASWIRKHGEGRVFYTSMGHREDVWQSPEFRSFVVGGITWAVGDAEADTTPNIQRVTPNYEELAAE